MKPDIYYCHKCKRSHGQGECGKREAKKVLPERASEGGGVQFPLADRDQVRSRVRVPAPEKSGGDIARGGALGSDSRERPAPSQSDIDALLKAYQAKEEHKRKLKREQMQRYRARK